MARTCGFVDEAPQVVVAMSPVAAPTESTPVETPREIETPPQPVKTGLKIRLRFWNWEQKEREKALEMQKEQEQEQEQEREFEQEKENCQPLQAAAGNGTGHNRNHSDSTDSVISLGISPKGSEKGKPTALTTPNPRVSATAAVSPAGRKMLIVTFRSKAVVERVARLERGVGE
jgi:hypothetical protein